MNTSFLDLLFYVLGGLVVMGAIYVAYCIFKRKQKEKTNLHVEREQELEQLFAEKKKVQANNEKLIRDISKQSKELAATTLLLVRKNELLVQIKNELITLPDPSKKLTSIIGNIDRNLNKTDDWELFKDAFTHTDRKFLKKLEKKHPNLTPNDIRLCAYLRLNLSSKEMAPLFNISTRSVEIKRYRLRKKLNLSQDSNLVNYILKL